MVTIAFEKRNKKIYELHKKNPRLWSYRKIGRVYNLSGMRICQIVKQEKQKEENPEVEIRSQLGEDAW